MTSLASAVKLCDLNRWVKLPRLSFGSAPVDAYVEIGSIQVVQEASDCRIVSLSGGEQVLTTFTIQEIEDEMNRALNKIKEDAIKLDLELHKKAEVLRLMLEPVTGLRSDN